jgi:23S rRNA (adenine2030-N6)-methyltransferase
MFILNPPYTLEPMLRETMPYLVQVLGKDAGARFTIETGTQVTGAAARMAADGPRVPVGNARRASPLSGKGSLRLPGQSMPREGEEDPRAVNAAAAAPGGAGPTPPKTGARRVWRPDGTAAAKPAGAGQGAAGASSKRPVAPGGTGLRTGSARKAAPGAGSGNSAARTGGPRPAGKAGNKR